MPQRVRCNECEELLYEGGILKSPSDIYKKHDGHCPACKKELPERYEKDLVNVTISAAEETE